jgi:hypothetical protein
VLPIESLSAKRSDWEEAPNLHRTYRAVIERIKLLTSHGLMAIMVLHDFLSRRITPLQDHTRPTWLYTGEGDTTRLERDCNSDLAPDMLGALLGRLNPNLSSVNFVTPPAVCAPMCSNQVMRTRLLGELPTLDNIGITTRQRGDESRGVQIPRADIAGGQGGVSTGPGSDKGKGKVAPQIVLSDTEVSSEEDDVPLQRRMRLFRSDGSTVGRPPLSRQQASNPATASQPDPMVAASVATGPGESGGGGSATSVKKVADTTAAVAAKKAADVAATKEAAAKMTADAAAVKKATDDVAARVAVEDFAVKAVTSEKAAKESAAQEAAKMEATKKAVEESADSGSSPAPRGGVQESCHAGRLHPSF